MRSAFEEFRKRWAEAFDHEDLDGLVELYTENGVFYDSDGFVSRGRKAIRAHFEELFAELEKVIPGARPHFDSTVEDEEVFGDVGYEFGSYRITAPNGKVLMEGSYSGIGRRIGDDWKIARHMTTAHAIAPAPEKREKQLAPV